MFGVTRALLTPYSLFSLMSLTSLGEKDRFLQERISHHQPMLQRTDLHYRANPSESRRAPRFFVLKLAP